MQCTWAKTNKKNRLIKNYIYEHTHTHAHKGVGTETATNTQRCRLTTLFRGRTLSWINMSVENFLVFFFSPIS